MPFRLQRVPGARTSIALLGALLLLPILPMHGADLFDDDMGDLALDEEDAISEAEILKRIDAAIREADLKKRTVLLRSTFATIRTRDDVVVPKRTWQIYVAAMLADLPADELRAAVPPLLEARNGDLFDPGVLRRLRLGIRIAAAVGGADYAMLADIFKTQRGNIELDWMLPALGRAGGAKAEPLIRREKKGVLVAHAGLLALAYTGDPAALQQILDTYEEDTVQLPRLAFFISWAKGEGMRPDYNKLYACEHRIAQAERLLAWLGPKKVPELIGLANESLGVSLVSYLIRRLGDVPPGEMAPYLKLLDHPAFYVRMQTMKALEARGDDRLRQQALSRVKALGSSKKGLDRFFAANALIVLDPNSRGTILAKAIEDESNAAVRERLQRLRLH